MNLVGYVRGDMGVGESVRLAAQALDCAEIPRSICRIGVSGSQAKLNLSFSEYSEHPYYFNIAHINADEFPEFVQTSGRELDTAHTTIGYWAWELEEFPEKYTDSFQHCSEVWTPSKFCTDAIGQRATVPVHTVPHPIRQIKSNGLSRIDFGLQTDGKIFLTIADLLSVADRKNPVGAIEAFRKAFGNSEDVQLVVKISNGSADRAAMA